jgi:single-stranded-DNA-specific exonuclease
LVRWGLTVMRQGRRKGLRALLDAMRAPIQHLTEDDIAFSIAPKINASSRMESPLLGLELLTTNDSTRAKELAKKLIDLNGARKLEGARVGKEVKKRLDGAVLSSVIVMGHSTWNPALLGIAATGVVETYQRTVCLWGKDGELIKGSCRSDGSVNIVSLMSSASHLFEDYGGHELSGGFSLKSDAIHALPAVLEEAYATLKSDVAVEPAETDGTLTVGEVTDALYDSLRHLAPFGIGNQKPVFRFTNVAVERVMMFGSGKEHARITISDESGNSIDAVSFFASRAPFHQTLELLAPGDRVTLDASIERSYFGNKKELRLRVENLTI